MKATLGTLPPADREWAYEIKWDGYRTLALVDHGRVQLQSSNRHDVTEKWPELAPLAEGVNAKRVILDGELVVVDDEGRPRFELVQRHDRQAALFVFDVLSLDGHETIALPYEDRRTLLEGVLEPGANWMAPAHRVGDGAALVEATAAQGLEGVLAKRLGSTYTPGKRSRDWLKIKNRTVTEVVVGGFTAGAGNRSGSFGALLVGRFDGGALVFAGGVGTGFSTEVLNKLTSQLRDLSIAECPFEPPPPTAYARAATWVDPQLVATIEIAEFTNDGLVRHASFIGLTGDPT